MPTLTAADIIRDLTSPKPTPFDREIRQLRRAIRQTQRKVQDGTLDHKSGALLLSKLANSLAQLRLAEHRLSPHSESYQVQSLRALCTRLFAALGFAPLPAEDP